jgi:hypothetical protein
MPPRVSRRRIVQGVVAVTGASRSSRGEIAMRCASCRREQAVDAILCSECWLPLRAQPPCTARAHFWHLWAHEGPGAIHCYYCGLVISDPHQAD